MSDLNKKNINYGALNRFYQNLKSHDLSGLATEQYVDDAIAEIPQLQAGNNISIEDGVISCTYQYSLPTASSSTLGGVKVGDGLSISNEVLSTIITPAILFKLLLNPDLINPLTFEATEDNTEIIFKGSAYIEVSNDGENWTGYTATSEGTLIGILNTNEHIFVRGENSSYSGSNFQFSKDTYVYGNIMSLINKYNYPIIFELGGTWTFEKLFKDNIHLLSHQTKKLCLPAKTLQDNCYNAMFRGCTSLTTAPELPATILTFGCYNRMFQDCTSLTTAPVLPATTLAEYCYSNMFSGCSSLTTAPALPATTLASSCYSDMFSSCTSLTNAPALPATTLASSCYGDMFYGCSSLTTAPELSATTLASACYYYMFRNCSNLNYIKCIMAEQSSIYDYCYLWTEGVSATGTFVTPQSAIWTTGTSGIPSGWTRQDV